MLSSVCTEPVMPSDASKNSSPQPGEIWETDRGYVMIVHRQETTFTAVTFTVMGLSAESSDALIPAKISGIDQDLFAETTNIFRLSRPDLLRQRGDRLSRQYYDNLMTLGDNLEAQQWANVVLTRSLQIEQTLQQINVTPLPRPRPIALSNWFKSQFEPAWVSVETLILSGQLHLTPPTRSPENGIPDAEELNIPNLIEQLASHHPETQRRRAAKHLGTTTPGNPTVIQAVIQALIALLRSTDDDETLWAAVESLWQIDPGNPAAGVRRVRLLDLGLQVSGRTVALAIAILQRQDQRLGIMLRVYPTENEPYVPEDLKLILLDEANQTYEVSARRHDLYIQLKFNGTPGERFGVQVKLGEAQMTEEFLL
jgi:hypothetical protein